MELRIAWLAGIVDGEGCIQSGITRWKGRVHHLTVTVHVGNTDPRIIEEAAAIYDHFGIRYCLPAPQSPGKRRPLYSIVVSNFQPVTTLLNLVMPHLISKKEQAALLLRIIEQRKQSTLRRVRNELGQFGGTWSPLEKDEGVAALIQELQMMKRQTFENTGGTP